MQEPNARVLGASRSLAEALALPGGTKGSRELAQRVAAGNNTQALSLSELESALLYYTNNNSNYVTAGEDDFNVLLDEVLNNAVRSVLVFDERSNAFGDEEVASLASALQHNLSVEALTLSGINVSDETIGVLCESIVHSRVGFIDLSRSPLEDDAGMSLAALAHINPFLRTVVVDDTLISDDVLDEIDVACQFNQSNFEGNDNRIDPALFSAADLARLRSRLQLFVRCHAKKTHFCVLHLFDCCPHGELCLHSHKLNRYDSSVESGGLSDKITELFTSGGKWEEKLPPKPREGASWRSPDDDTGPRLTLRRLRPAAATGPTGEAAATSSVSGRRGPNARIGVAVAATAAVAIAFTGIVVFRIRNLSSHS